MSDYIPFDIFNPMTGQPLRIFDVSPAAVSRVDNLDTNAGDERKHVYTGFDLNAAGAAAARRHAVRRLRDRAEPAQHLRRAGRSEHAALLRRLAERHSVPPDVEAGRHLSAQVGHLGERGVPEPGRPSDRPDHHDRQQDQRPRLRRHRQPGRHQLPDPAHHAVSGQLPGAVPGRRARGADADLGIGDRAASSRPAPSSCRGSTSSISASRRSSR